MGRVLQTGSYNWIFTGQGASKQTQDKIFTPRTRSFLIKNISTTWNTRQVNERISNWPYLPCSLKQQHQELKHQERNKQNGFSHSRERGFFKFPLHVLHFYNLPERFFSSFLSMFYNAITY